MHANKPLRNKPMNWRSSNLYFARSPAVSFNVNYDYLLGSESVLYVMSFMSVGIFSGFMVMEVEE